MTDNIPDPEEKEIEFEVIPDEEAEDQTEDTEDTEDESDDDFTATADLDDDELENYLAEHQPKGTSSFVRRLKKAHRNFHDQRRAREEAEKMREEAVRYAQALTNELNEIRKRSSETEKLFVTEAVTRIDAQLADAKARMQRAHEEGDTEAFVAASEDISRLTTQKTYAQQYQPQDVEETPPYQPAQEQEQPPIDRRSAEWIRKNSWFNSPGYEEMTSYAVGVHNRLVNQGVDPVRDADTYFAEIDGSLRKRFPENFEQESKPKKKSPVAGAERASGAPPRKFKISPTAEKLANRLGVPLEEYAKHAMKLEE